MTYRSSVTQGRLRLETGPHEHLGATMGAIIDYLKEKGFHLEPQECVWVIAFDANLGVHTIVEIGRGTHTNVNIHLPTLLGAVVAAGCERFILVHNHPTNSVAPSAADLEVTREVMEAANATGLYFEDHIILAHDGRWVSLAQRGDMIPVDYLQHATAAHG